MICLSRIESGSWWKHLGREFYIRALREVDELAADVNLRQRCRAVARQYFDLGTIGGARYHRLYMRVTESYGRSELAD